MAIRDPNELLVYELSATYNAERTLLQGMQEMFNAAQNSRVKQMLDDHIRESQRQIQGLEQCFNDLGVRPLDVTCYVAEGFVKDFRAVSQEVQIPELIDLAILGTMDEVEHFETAGYAGLTGLARLCGQDRVAQILHQIFNDEQKEARLVESAEKDLGPQIIGRFGAGPSAGPRIGL